MGRFGWTAAGVLVLTLSVFITIEWVRQEWAIAMYWTAKLREGYRPRKRNSRFK